ncbi:DUF2489 domain-containing protein [Denitrificimonas sp. JX-1]|uniref:DUF2489 domain-containing protein n=1 Tax=Denitrificimonas halotolerans TaxID=3098930 RepID=A0ABU5GQP9_9GAMM|nr:DUF2489 domain-containing protein [Denitrificimonas sp. JX-1]MDY7219055.1 DUF2489 domain-containing protein [Denitrificimonas sp. JX-1]
MLSNFWLILGAVCILALTLYAILLWRRVWHMEKQRKQQLAKQKSHLRNDLIILANSFLTEQMPWAEGCIRIKVILDHYDAELGMQPQNQVLQTIFEATKHIPSHDSWKALTNAEKLPYQRLLSELELKHKKASSEAVKQLLNQLKN